MREIKFRAWDKKSKYMAYTGFRLTAKGTVFPSESYWEKNPDLILMQYTGLKDKNGKEIYEGDILKYWLPTLKKEKVGKVEWNSDWCAFWLNGKDWSEIDWVKIQNLEVIGNIYENPELLKEAS